MKKIFLTSWACLALSIVFSQTEVNPLDDINNVRQAKKFIAKYPKSSAQLITVSSNKDTSDTILPLYNKKAGDTYRLDEYDYKILDKVIFPEFRVSYIFLDGSQLTDKAINKLRTEIVNKYKSGVPFSELVKAYSMDSTPDGDLGWFTENTMAKEFEQAIKQHKRNDIYTVDVLASKWYFVVLKTFDDRVTHRLTVFKLKTGT